MPTSSAARDSYVSVSKFNRWVVGEQNQGAGDQGRMEQSTLRTQRVNAAESHREYGASLAAASRAQIQRDRQKCDEFRQSNLAKGHAVRDEIASQRDEAQRLKTEWVEYGRKLAEKDADQRRKIKQVCGEGSQRVQDIVAQQKYEEEEFKQELAEFRAFSLQERQQAVQRVREETARSVTDASKEFALERRKQVANSTKSAKAQWGKEERKNTDEHLRTARKNRADAEASRAHAKKLRERIIAQRQKEASAAKEAMRRNKLVRDQMALDQGAGVKAVHDSIYRAKYVPPDSADLLATSKYGRVLHDGPTSPSSPTKSVASSARTQRPVELS
jgi:hypothetical protein